MEVILDIRSLPVEIIHKLDFCEDQGININTNIFRNLKMELLSKTHQDSLLYLELLLVPRKLLRKVSRHQIIQLKSPISLKLAQMFGLVE